MSAAAEALTLAPEPAAHAAAAAPLAWLERLVLRVQLTLAMLAAGLLAVALGWEWAFPQQTALATLVAGVAAVLVAVPVLAAAWQSLRRPSLHGITDRLIALALIAAWASGDLTTAAVLQNLENSRRPVVVFLFLVVE
jgi:Zn2+/Cd2+-exporting ATPase